MPFRENIMSSIQGMKLASLREELRDMADPKRASFLARYFKTGKGQYAEGDVFLGGIDTPTLSLIVGKYKSLSMSDIRKLIKSKYHEERMAALGILKKHFEKAEGEEKKEIYKFYLANTKYINNWDLVDVTAPKIIGSYLIENPKLIGILNKLALSGSLWERRIAIVSTFAFLKDGDFGKTLEIAEKLIQDKEDLIHKAVGWALREVGKKDWKVEEVFLRKHYRQMPRTMLRYAIEKFPEPLRRQYLSGEI
jgi:3-methyladenine DNA glycosylase AlkD